MVRKNYRSVKIPEELVVEIENIIKTRGELSYKSKSEFVKDAVRRRLEEIKKI